MCGDLSTVEELASRSGNVGLMPRRPRYVLPDGMFHVAGRAVFETALFEDDYDRRVFLTFSADRSTSSGSFVWRTACSERTTTCC
jgi:hypothetical protein